MIGLSDTLKSAACWLSHIVVGYLAIILVIEVIGIRLHSNLTRFWAAEIYAFGLFIFGVLAASATSMVIYQDLDSNSYIMKPLFWLVMYGLIPALIIGFIVLRFSDSPRKKKENKTLVAADRNIFV
jgi:hypothetical protein